MSSFNDSSDYTNNASTLNSDVTYDRESADASSYTEDRTSRSPSRKSTSDNDFTSGSISNGADGLVNDDSYLSGYDSRTYDSRTYDSRTYDTRTYDTRTYDSYTYEDSSVPQSPRSDELSSTFASFYLESDTFRKIRSTISFLRKPLIFFSLAIPGTGGIGAICRVVHAVTVGAVQRRSSMTPKTFHNPYELPDGYMRFPPWMQNFRLSLPPLVENIVKKMLNNAGVPALTDLQRERWAKAMEELRRAGGEVVSHTTQVTSGPMVPLVVFLPLFSFVVISVARHIVARRQALAEDEEDEEENMLHMDDLDIFGSTEIEGLPLLRSVDDSHSVIKNTTAALAAITAYEEGPNGNHNHLHDNLNSPSNNDDHHSSVSGLPPRPATLAPSESPTNPHTVPNSRDLSPVSSIHEEISTFEDVPNGKGTATTTTKPATPGTGTSIETGVGIPVTPIQMVRTAPYALKGDVVAAVVGEPAAKEVNVLLVAAARYNCRRVVLPKSVPSSLLVSVPPSLSVERVGDVMEYVMSVEEPRGLTTVGVFHRPVTDDTVDLSLFTHPSSAVYVFVPSGDVGEMVVSHLVERCIYSSPSLDEPIPANACFYDRSVKERASGSTSNNNGIIS
ncbi:uncharacterized protein TM35_000212420 [Trypanosoma theileri]|uniref:Transmembrane protein n=1 Tax=Trypanosoma theileri TaxID=67003 RepID=A0A1X0NSG0_9TRYP|nr:uncharacterized protein TM35_000212420 [Trypanosoma theileri]ORC87636.1 hypothetical protein TM35_000212420 [Trypanosoma theileri]